MPQMSGAANTQQRARAAVHDRSRRFLLAGCWAICAWPHWQAMGGSSASSNGALDGGAAHAAQRVSAAAAHTTPLHMCVRARCYSCTPLDAVDMVAALHAEVDRAVGFHGVGVL